MQHSLVRDERLILQCRVIVIMVMLILCLYHISQVGDQRGFAAIPGISMLCR